MSFGSQTSVIAAKRGSPSFCIALDQMWSLVILRSGKKGLGLLEVSKAFKNTFGKFEKKSDIKFEDFC